MSGGYEWRVSTHCFVLLLQSKYPQANITQLKPWHGHFPQGTYFLSPGSELFEQVRVGEC